MERVFGRIKKISGAFPGISFFNRKEEISILILLTKGTGMIDYKRILFNQFVFLIIGFCDVIGGVLPKTCV
jgi:hypothetical protein